MCFHPCLVYVLFTGPSLLVVIKFDGKFFAPSVSKDVKNELKQVAMANLMHIPITL